MRILPDKTIRLQYSLLGVGGVLVRYMNGPETVTSLWNKVRNLDGLNTYEKYISGLTLLYSLNAIRLENGILYKNED